MAANANRNLSAQRGEDTSSSMSAREGHEVAVSIAGDVVTLVFNGDEADPVEYGADIKIADQQEIQSLTNKSGNPPRGKNMRALLRCDGDRIVFDEKSFRISVPPQPNGKLRCCFLYFCIQMLLRIRE
jgi:hypothetical protein